MMVFLSLKRGVLLNRIGKDEAINKTLNIFQRPRRLNLSLSILGTRRERRGWRTECRWLQMVGDD